MHILFLLSMGCRDKEQSPADTAAPADTAPSSTDDTAAPTDTADTGKAPITWSVLPEGCEAPKDLGTHPITLLGEDQHTQEIPGSWFVELVDLEADLDAGLVYGVGQGGLMIYDVSSPADPTLLGGLPGPDSGNTGRYYRLELAGEGRVLTTHRDQGLYVIDVSDPVTPEILTRVEVQGVEGMALVDNILYMTNLFGQLYTADVSSLKDPILIDELDGMSTPWDIVVHGDVGYISDGQDGVVVVDLSEPTVPVLIGAVDVGGGVQDIAVHGDALYAAAGGVGVVVLDASEPLAPTVHTILDYAGSVQSVAVQDDILWAVDQEDVIAIDVADPLTPIPIGTSLTPEFSMHVAAGDGVAWVGDWSRLQSWQASPDVLAPDLELSVTTMLLDTTGDEITLTLHNVGGAALSLVGAELGDDRLGLEVSADTIAPGDSAQLRLTYAGGDDLQSSLCLASNDPDTPTLSVEVHTGAGGNHEAIGEPAIDFALEDLDGSTHVLSEQLGRPVVLVYFATW